MAINVLLATQVAPVSAPFGNTGAANAAPVPAPISKPQLPAPAHVQIDKLLKLGNTRLDFNVDPHSHEIVLRIIDGESGDLLYQVPNDVAMNIAKWLDVSGHPLLNETA